MQVPSSAPIGRAIEHDAIHIPAHFDAEVLATLRREVLNHRIELARALSALREAQQIVATRHAVTPMLFEAMALRDRFGAHDALFVILARQLDATLVTSDARLARAADGFVRLRAFV